MHVKLYKYMPCTIFTELGTMVLFKSLVFQMWCCDILYLRVALILHNIK